MREEPRRIQIWFVACLALVPLAAIPAVSQQDAPAEVPRQFKLDLEAARHLRAQLLPESVTPDKSYAGAGAVFGRLVAQLPPSNSKFDWELRIVNDGQWNAFSSPDGTVYVESGLAQIAGASTGLWAAILSHEIAHVVRRDWARRYLYHRYLENGGGANIVLGDPSLPSASWSDSEKSSEDFARFCRQMELEADREGLRLMARAGYHPDFVPALHHLLHANTAHTRVSVLYGMHPCWEERDRELAHAYAEASSEFARMWPEWYASPGGNPPVVVFAGEPKIRQGAAHEWEVQVPLRCQNLAGAVEVVLRSSGAQMPDRILQDEDATPSKGEIRQVTGCTSPTTTVTFTLATGKREPSDRWTDIYLLDAWGSVLARADLPRLRD